MLFREFRIAIANGIALAIVGALGTYVVLGDPQLSLVFAMALVINSLVAGLVGVIVPVTLDKARIDPAVSSGGVRDDHDRCHGLLQLSRFGGATSR